MYFRPVDGERCDTVVADVPWLSAAEPGTHHATVLVRTDDPGAAEVRVPVTVTVTAP